MAHIEKREGSKLPWRARYRIAEGKDKGKERSKAFRTKREAEAFLARTVTAMARGDWMDPAMRKVTVGQLSERLLAAKSRRSRTSARPGGTSPGRYPRRWCRA